MKIKRPDTSLKQIGNRNPYAVLMGVQVVLKRAVRQHFGRVGDVPAVWSCSSTPSYTCLTSKKQSLAHVHEVFPRISVVILLTTNNWKQPKYLSPTETVYAFLVL